MRALLMCLFLTGCATAPGQGQSIAPAYLVAGVRAPAPEGLLDYCRREPADCGGAVEEGHVALGSTGAARAEQPEAPPLAMLEAVAQARRAARPTSAPPGSRVALDDTRLRDLREVAREVLGYVHQDSDLAIYGQAEYWRRPVALGAWGARGDCEDIALEMRARLIARGWPADALALAVAIEPRTGLHAALVVQTDRGDFVLDSLNDGPRPLSSLAYVWLTRQAGPTLSYWTIARPTAALPRDEIQSASRMQTPPVTRMPVAYLGAGRNRIRP